jgi:endonuclease/exonuclease/phosphatase family metal-dependent hydrolase
MTIEDQPTAPADAVQLLQWNTLNSVDASAVHEHLSLIARTHGALDVISLEEVQFETADQLPTGFTASMQDGLGQVDMVSNRMYELRRHAYQASTPFMGSIISSRFPILESSTRPLSEEGEFIKRHGDLYRPSCLVAKVAVPEWGTELTLANVHLAWDVWPGSRDSELDHLIGLIESMSGKFVLKGDFNATPWSKTIKAVREHLVMVNDPGEPTWRWQGFGKSLAPAQTLDYVFVSEDLDGTARVLDRGPSDHSPILAQIRQQ